MPELFSTKGFKVPDLFTAEGLRVPDLFRTKGFRVLDLFAAKGKKSLIMYQFCLELKKKSPLQPPHPQRFRVPDLFQPLNYENFLPGKPVFPGSRNIVKLFFPQPPLSWGYCHYEMNDFRSI